MGTERTIDLLDQALISHQRWASRLHRGLIAGAAPEAADLQPDAHRRCAFGRWYYEALSHPEHGLAELPAFQGIGEIHARMHDHARALLLSPPSEQRLQHYDRFAATSGRLVDETRALQQQVLTRLLSVDALTGLPGRRNMEERLALEWQQLQRQGQDAAIAMMDIDHFKHINDVYGHHGGDEVLRWIGRGAREQLRAGDLVFRYGGEEFLALIGDGGHDTALGILERVRRGIEAAEVELSDGRRLRLTCSFGIAACEAGLTIAEIIARADAALYRAKQSGRNRVVCWQPGVKAAA